MAHSVSVIIVNYNGQKYLQNCFNSIFQTDQSGLSLEIIMVDNQSSDDSVKLVTEDFPEIKVIRNSENNFAKALNIGIKNAKGNYIALLNNDMTVEKDWLQEALHLMTEDPSIGAVQSKIRFMGSNRINSAGVEEIEDFYFRDIGFGEQDRGQYETIRSITYFSGGAVLLNRDCIEDVGAFDEDFIMYAEDVDYSIRCNDKGWKIYYQPKSTVNHKYQGSASSELCEYLCSRNRLVCLAKHFPFKLPAAIKSSHFYQKGEYDYLYDAMLSAFKSLVKCQGQQVQVQVLDELKHLLIEVFGYRKAYNFFSQLELTLGLRKIRIGIYDHAFHFAGGGQRYVAKIAEFLKSKFDITYIVNKDVALSQYKEWFDIDLHGCELRVIDIPFFEERNRYFIDEGMVTAEDKNPFDIISHASLDYDIFINANMLGKVRPLSTLSVFVCHFPDRDKERFFHVHEYDYLISNGSYTSEWISKRWGLEPTHCIYPPVEMYNDAIDLEFKKNIILSVARFEIGGSKKQLELVNTFIDMCREAPELMDNWRLVLAGGNFPNNPYFNMVRKRVDETECQIELKPDIGFRDLKQLYLESAVFWHACGLGETQPHLIEHFGMTTVEAMQNYCVPVVYDGGGQREIVENGETGFMFRTVDELKAYSFEIIRNNQMRGEIAQKAYARSHDFNFDAFRKHISEFFDNLELRLTGAETL